MDSVSGFLRHIDECHRADLPGGRTRFLLGGDPVGWLAPHVAAALAETDGVRRVGDTLVLAEAASLHGVAERLARRGLFRWRGEAFDVHADADPNGPALARIDRGALPAFGIVAKGAHLNGLVRRADGLHLWIARRAADKALDPGKLDHVTAGGVPAGLSPFETLVKEAQEEAAIPADLARQARETACIVYAMDRPEGLRRDRIHCYDLALPEGFTPRAADGEVESFALWPIARVFAAVRDTDDFKFNVNLVLTDLFLRLGLFGAAETALLRDRLLQRAA